MSKVIRPIDLLRDANNKSVAGFKRLTELPCCYYCAHHRVCNSISGLRQSCLLHQLEFGDDANGVANTVEFICDDFTRE